MIAAGVDTHGHRLLHGQGLEVGSQLNHVWVPQQQGVGHLRAVEVGTATQDQRAAHHYPHLCVCVCVCVRASL